MPLVVVSSHQRVHEQNSVMVDAKSKNNICTEVHLKMSVILARPSKQSQTILFFVTLYFCQNHFRISANHFIIFGKGYVSTIYFLHGV